MTANSDLSEFEKVSAELDTVESSAEITDRQASRVVAAYATDADECRVLLAMLGIGPAKIDA